MISIIPAIDIIGGRCVRLRQGDFAQQTVYDDDPLAVARRFEEAGLRRLHLVDLDGARDGSPSNLDVLRAITASTGLVVDFSGGVREERDLMAVLDAGAAYAGVGSLAVRKPEVFGEWVDRYGAGRFFVGADVRDGEVTIDGWTKGSGMQLFPFLGMLRDLGVSDVFCTDVSMDGMLEGPALDLYASIIDRFPELRLSASGGVRNLADIDALAAVGCSGVIVGKALFEERITLRELRQICSVQ